MTKPNTSPLRTQKLDQHRIQWRLRPGPPDAKSKNDLLPFLTTQTTNDCNEHECSKTGSPAKKLQKQHDGKAMETEAPSWTSSGIKKIKGITNSFLGRGGGDYYEDDDDDNPVMNKELEEEKEFLALHNQQKGNNGGDDGKGQEDSNGNEDDYGEDDEDDDEGQKQLEDQLNYDGDEEMIQDELMSFVDSFYET
jgi:hypothetical protein